MEELSSLSPAVLHHFLWVGIEQHDEVLRKAPQALRDFFETLDEPPPWLDYDAFRPGIRAFHANVDLMLVAFVTGVLVEGFFDDDRQVFQQHRASGVDQETPPAEQPPHDGHILSPRGLYRENDGWKLSTRIRFVHSRIRTLLDKSEDWNHEAWGRPVSAAHRGFAISVFSKRLLEYSLQMGARLDKNAFTEC